MRTRAHGMVVVALGVFLASTAVAGPGDGINNSLHNLSTSGTGWYANGENRICIFCHAPHNTYKLDTINNGPANPSIGGGENIDNIAYTYLPLWNHAPTANASFDMYENGVGAPLTGAKASQAKLQGGQPGGVSQLCLSCHDGSIAVNAYGSSTWQISWGDADKSILSGKYLIGKDGYLGNHHPIGFNYLVAEAQDQAAVGGIRPASTNMTSATSIQDHLYGENGAQTQLECATCHSVHNTGNTGEALLWRSDENSELCLTCHAKGDYTPAP